MPACGRQGFPPPPERGLRTFARMTNLPMVGENKKKKGGKDEESNWFYEKEGCVYHSINL
jgi:hypothetical protein